MDLPPSSHFIYIPVVMILGVALGFIWGARTTREAYVLQQKRNDERDRRKAERAAARAAAAGDKAGDKAGDAG